MKTFFFKTICILTLSFSVLLLVKASSTEITEATITVSNTETIYNGESQGVEVETYPAGLNVLITYNGYYQEPSEVGTYELVVQVIDDEYEGTYTGDFYIYKATASISFSNKTVVFDSANQSITLETEPADLNVSVTYNGSDQLPIDAGTYSVMAIINETNYNGGEITNFVIQPAEAEINVDLSDLDYNGEEQSVTVLTQPSNLDYSIIYDNVRLIPVDAGVYTVEVEVTDPNYSASFSGELIVNKADAEIIMTSKNYTYDGEEKPVSVSTIDNLEIDVYYNGSSTVAIDAGLYDVTAIIDDINYQGNISGSFEIFKAESEIILTDLESYYDGSSKAPTVSTVPEDLGVNMYFNGSTDYPVNAADYFILVAVNDKNYEGFVVDTFSVLTQSQEIIWDQDLSGIVVGDEVELQAQTTTGLELNYKSNNPDVADVKGNILYAAHSGKTIIKAYQSGNENVAEVYDSVEVDIKSTSSLSISQGVEANIVTAWPNPVQDNLNVYVNSDNITQIEISILNTEGKVLKKEVYTSLNTVIDFSNYAAGFYIVQVKTGDWNKQLRVLRK